jgi:N-methylhydantoinase A
MATGRVRIGVDVGGTFTDLVLLDEAGFSAVKKVLSTPPDYSEGIATGLAALLRENDCAPGSVAQLVHATTVATNTVLEFKGARTALLTTAGFRDILEMRRLRIPVLYDIQYEKPPPLVPRRLRVEVTERLNADGSVRAPLDSAAVLAAAQTFKRERVGAVAIGFLHSYINPRHEIEAEALLRRELGEAVYICRSSDILPEIREYERISTAVVNAYIAPVVKNYLLSLQARLRGIGVGCMIEIMNSAGGVMRFHSALRRPAYLVESGPAAGVVAAARIAALASQDKVISFDKGGTTAKAAMIESGAPARTTEYEVGAGINLSSKLVKGSGYPIKLPFIDVSEIGAGGGSLIRIDEHGRVSVGPQSAGAVPGPVCYDRGGEQATLTDALVTLGYINPTALAGGSVALNAAKARAALEAQIAKPLGKPMHEAAYGVLTLAVATMTRAVKAVSTYRGRDPREFVLHAFGGNGAVVACEIARALQMQRVLVPTAAGVFSAFGLLYADVVQEAMRTQIVRTQRADLKQVGRTFETLESEVSGALRADGYAAERISMERQADLRYAGQAYELTLPVNRGPVDLVALVAAFHAEHERTYGHRSDNDPVEIVNLRVAGRVASAVRPAVPKAAAAGARMKERAVYFGPDFGLRQAAVGLRADLANGPRQGPLIIEDYDSTCVVPPDWKAELDRFGNVAISFAPERSNDH